MLQSPIELGYITEDGNKGIGQSSLQLSCLQENLPGDEVPNHNHGCGENLHYSVVDVNQLRAGPHQNVVNQKADNRQDDERGELAESADVVPPAEHEAHAGHVVEQYRNNERNGGGNNGVKPKHLGKENHHTEVDKESQKANKPEFHKLLENIPCAACADFDQQDSLS